MKVSSAEVASFVLLIQRLVEPSDAGCPTTNLLENGDFETGDAMGWVPLGDYDDSVVLDVSPSYAQSGDYGMKITGRTQDWHGMEQEITHLVHDGTTYETSVWARVSGGDSTTTTTTTTEEEFGLLVEQIDDSPSSPTYFQSLFTSTLTTQWQEVTGGFTLHVTGTLYSLRLSTWATAGVDVEVDNLRLNCAPPLPRYTIAADNNTEHVQLPVPQVLPPQRSQQNCPHWGDNVIDWFSLFPSPCVHSPITLPSNTKVLVSKSIPTQLGMVTIPRSSELIIGENTTGITMNVTGMQVDGTLTIGSEACRIETPVIITLHGSRPTTNPQPPSYKGISVTGTLHLHGKRYSRTWTRLAQRATPGDDRLYLQDAVNWEAGQRIVLVTSALRDSREWHENEEFVLRRVDRNPTNEIYGSIVYLDSLVTHAHIAHPGYQVEVRCIVLCVLGGHIWGPEEIVVP